VLLTVTGGAFPSAAKPLLYTDSTPSAQPESTAGKHAWFCLVCSDYKTAGLGSTLAQPHRWQVHRQLPKSTAKSIRHCRLCQSTNVDKTGSNCSCLKVWPNLATL
jgi:hypothetical protein